MNNMRWIIAALVCTGIGQAASPDYFPLQVGNRWVLQTSGDNPQLLTIDVLRTRSADSNVYFLVSGYAPGDVWLREASDGTLYALNDSGGEAPVSPSPCSQMPQRSVAPYRGPEFDYQDAIEVDYSPGTCRDAGITQEFYAAGVGPVKRSMTTIAGPVTYDLVYAKVNGAPVMGRSQQIVLADNFSRGSNGWLAGFTDYSLQTTDLRFLAELRPLPEEVDTTHAGFYVQSVNRSDDVFMFLKRIVESADGLAPNQTYRVSFDLQLASNAPSGCSGVGGAPGESVYLKAGAMLDEPLAMLSGGVVTLSADKGQQAHGGKDAAVIGNVANGTPCTGAAQPYVSLRRVSSEATISADQRGSLWLLVGTDSGFEGLTGLYYQSITTRITPAVSAASGRRR